jgi:high affinity Mn2+ porin
MPRIIIIAVIVFAAALPSAALGQYSVAWPNQSPSAPTPAYTVIAQNPPVAQNASVPPSDGTQTPPGTPQPDVGKKDDDNKDDGKEDRKRDDKKETDKKEEDTGPQTFNFHAQTTATVQGDPGFPAQYSGPNSLNSMGERQGTVVADLFAGLHVWQGGEVHGDFMMWQGYGLSNTFGIEDFPNADAYKAGTSVPDFTAAHLFFRQTFGLGGEQEDVPDSVLALRGKQDIERVTVTVGRFSPTDMFDNNSYAKDPHTQFLNWANGVNATWDYAVDEVGFTTGISFEFNQPDWTLRYGFFQMPAVQNGFTADDRIFTWPGQGADGSFFQDWEMIMELERRWKIDGHPGAIRIMAWLNEAGMANYNLATAILLANPPNPNAPPGGNAPAGAQAIRHKYGLGLNLEQEIVKNVGMFSRVGWNDGQEEAWTYTDANWTAQLGLSVKGPLMQYQKRKDDTFGLAFDVSGASKAQQRFLEAGGLGILDGDGAGQLSYSPEYALETYYSFQLGKDVSLMFDYQFVADPAFNEARGPVSIFGARLHWEY